MFIVWKAKAQVASRVAPEHNIAPEEQLTEKVRSLVFLSWPPSHLDGANQRAFQRPWRLLQERENLKQAEGADQAGTYIPARNDSDSRKKKLIRAESRPSRSSRLFQNLLGAMLISVKASIRGQNGPISAYPAHAS